MELALVIWAAGRLVTLEQYLKVKSEFCRHRKTSLINLHQSKPASVGGAKRGTGQEAVD